MHLSDLGPRICIMGPSNSGKSTLAAAIARARDLVPIHLDRLYHRPDTDWQPRPEAEFLALHDAALSGARWVMDGNYARCADRRLARATGLILLDASVPTCLLRYVRRTLFERRRVGGLAGDRDSIKWAMIRHIALVDPENRRRHRANFDRCPLPKILIPDRRGLRAFYRTENLRR
ncbi:AAA family ATPase [Methylobacterium sp. NEAU 140]|uniref:AAA family ATPase n=1 Tax=Methylobacterium sp. NEAU 140 TaxID=3064945 RepID=UPI002735E48D|nr:AAA family ATPase [Methylobacterium sp. NEAU 140]MDP4025005.1 AAA family ATPase [Methylobacterium sp. NEAU 140]